MSGSLKSSQECDTRGGSDASKNEAFIRYAKYTPNVSPTNEVVERRSTRVKLSDSAEEASALSSFAALGSPCMYVYTE